MSTIFSPEIIKTKEELYLKYDVFFDFFCGSASNISKYILTKEELDYITAYKEPTEETSFPVILKNLLIS